MEKYREDNTIKIFNRISSTYDFINHLITFHFDTYWRRKAILRLVPYMPQKILDIATGTGDLAIAACKLSPEEVIGIDPAEKMLHVAQEKVKKKKLQNIITFRMGTAEAIPFADNYFDAVIMAFGIRNIANPNQAFKEIKRVLKQGGIVTILETSRPKNFPVKQLHRFYFQNVLPLLGRIVSNDRDAYQYFSETVMSFPQGDELIKYLTELKFRQTRYKTLTWGTVTIYNAIK